MDKLWHSSALFDDVLEIFVWITDELVNCLLIGKHAILLVILENSEIRFSRHQKPFLNNVN